MTDTIRTSMLTEYFLSVDPEDEKKTLSEAITEETQVEKLKALLKEAEEKPELFEEEGEDLEKVKNDIKEKIEDLEKDDEEEVKEE